MVICCSFSNAQQVDTTGNIIDNSQWTGVGAYAPDPNDCCSNPAGSQPLYDTSSDTIKFSYGQATVGQTIGLNSALSGSGLQVNGYTFQYQAKTTSENGSGSDPLTSSSYLLDGSGNVLASTTYQHGVHDWQTFSVSRTLTNPYSISGGGTIGVEFSGKDTGFWAGLYGPQVRNVDLRINYSVGEDPCIKDPLSSTSCSGYAEAYKSQQCSINPLYDTTCPGYAQAYFDQQCSLNPLYDQACPGYAQAYFNQQCGFNPLYDAACPGNGEVITSKNLVPNPGSWYREANQSFAINTALSHSGSGLQVHAFRWGFESFGFSLFGSPGDFKSDVNITDSNGNSIYSFSTGWQNAGFGYTDRSYYYQLPQSRNNLTLGTFEYNTEVTGLAAVGNFWARMLYTPDQCSLDPLSSPLCTGYQAAFLEQQCSIYVMYSPQCPGYAEALQKMLDEQAALSASATTEETSSDPVASVTNTASNNTSAQPAGTENPTEVTTDVGGAELTTTGEIVVADGIPSDVKEATKESTSSSENKEETSTASSETSDKKKTKVNAVALAQAAAREAEKTALNVAGDAQAASLSENANPADGIGLTGLGSGLTIPGLSFLATNQGQRVDEEDTKVVSTVTKPRSDSNKEEVQTVSVESNTNEQTEIVDAQPMATEQQETVASTGPSVRRGGRVEGMEGGADMEALSKPPADFNSYLAAQMQDAQFYASREIYRNQQNVDNARAFRALGSDRLHQQMVDQQWSLGQ